MSVLVVGVSHNTAPVAMLERLALDAGGPAKLIGEVVGAEHVAEATVIATCNRLEIYAEVERFHGSVETISRLLIERGGASTEAMLPHLYVHYDDAAVSHLFRVASGLDSMVIGEGQILGQVREALRVGQESGTVGPALNVLFQQALRVGKRSHAETEIDRAAPSLVGAALELAGPHVGGLAGRRAVVVGAGSMASLSVATLSRAGVDDIVVLNRTPDKATRLAQEYGARSGPLSALEAELVGADVVVSCTGSSSIVITEELVARVRPSDAGRAPRALALVDLALPHDVDPEVERLPGVLLVGLARLAEALQLAELAPGIEQVREIVTQEIAAFTTARRQASVTPTVVALRTMATTVVDAEIERLDGRLPGLDPATRDEVLQTVRRVADKLLHQPTVRVKQLANETGAVSYAAALAELFALDPDAVDAVTRPGGRA